MEKRGRSIISLFGSKPGILLRSPPRCLSPLPASHGCLSRKYLQATVQKPNLVCGRLILSYYIPSVDSSGAEAPLAPSFALLSRPSVFVYSVCSVCSRGTVRNRFDSLRGPRFSRKGSHGSVCSYLHCGDLEGASGSFEKSGR